MFNTVKANSTRQLSAVKKAGFDINLATTKNGYDAIVMKKDDKEYVAIAVKDFDGDITLDTYIFEGKNADEEPRLYLTNNAGGIKLGKAL